MPPKQWKMNVHTAKALATLFRPQEDGSQQGGRKDAWRLVQPRNRSRLPLALAFRLPGGHEISQVPG